MNYIVKRASSAVALDGDFENDPQWKNANVIELTNRMYAHHNIFARLWRKWSGAEEREKNDPYNPRTRLKLLYDDENIYGLFLVNDQYVRVTAEKYGDQACVDSCAEFFIRPANNLRYYNFEFSAGGYLLLYNITNLRKGKFTKVPESDCKSIRIFHSLPSKVDPEITEPTDWRIGFAIPIEFFVKFGDGVNRSLSGQTWTANVYKCGDETSHPHWYTWKPIPKLDFHLPDFFAPITFE